MKFNRREVLKGGLSSLGFMALPGGLFAAPPGWKPMKKPNLVLGVMSDSHLRVGYDAVTPGRAFPLKYVHNAFKLFKSRNIDAFVHCGDAAHRGCVREWEFHKELLDNGIIVATLTAGYQILRERTLVNEPAETQVGLVPVVHSLKVLRL